MIASTHPLAADELVDGAVFSGQPISAIGTRTDVLRWWQGRQCSRVEAPFPEPLMTRHQG